MVRRLLERHRHCYPAVVQGESSGWILRYLLPERAKFIGTPWVQPMVLLRPLPIADHACEKAIAAFQLSVFRLDISCSHIVAFGGEVVRDRALASSQIAVDATGKVCSCCGYPNNSD